MEDGGNGDGGRDKFNNLIDSLKGSSKAEGQPSLLNRATSGAAAELSSQALGKSAMKEVMDKAAADKAAALQGTGSGLKNRV